MSINVNTHTLKVGDQVRVQDSSGGAWYWMTVWQISPAGSGMTRESYGPHIHAHLRPGGYGITFHYGTTTHNVERIQ